MEMGVLEARVALAVPVASLPFLGQRVVQEARALTEVQVEMEGLVRVVHLMARCALAPAC